MNMSLRKIIYAASAAFIVGCNGNPSGEPQIPAFDSVEDCFNGRLIFSIGEKFGIAHAADSSILVQPAYERLSFISDNLALAKADGRWSLMDKDGHLVASSIDSSFLSGESIHLYECFLEEEALSWDRILDFYEKMSEKPDRKSLEELKKMISEVKLGMNEEQSERFRGIQSKHNQR